MKVLLIHSRYSTGELSGENRVVEQQIEYLSARGYVVDTIIFDSKIMMRKFLYKYRVSLKIMLKVLFDRKISSMARNFDLIILHNLFPNIGTGWLKKCSVPVVRFHHNYRDFCSNGLLFRDGQTCTLCLKGNSIYAVINSCYRDSRLATIPIAIATQKPLRHRLEYTVPAIHVAVSKYQAEIMLQAGYSSHNLAVLRNFAEEVPKYSPKHKRSSAWVTFGRLEPGKGFLELINNWPRNIRLDLIGDGSLFEHCSKLIQENSLFNIKLLGFRSANELPSILPLYFGGVIPGLTREPAPLVFPEMLSAGLPIIAMANTSSGEVIQKFHCGIVLENLIENEIKVAIDCLSRNYEDYSQRVRQVYQSHYSKLAWGEELESIISRATSRQI